MGPMGLMGLMGLMGYDEAAVVAAETEGVDHHGALLKAQQGYDCPYAACGACGVAGQALGGVQRGQAVGTEHAL